MQITHRLLMIRPRQFGFNTETAVNNFFQNDQGQPDVIHQLALIEFDSMVEKIQSQGIDVMVVDDGPDPATPDSIFPNNWFSTHEGGILVLYPLFAQNRRLERKPAVLNALKEKYSVDRQLDLTEYETSGYFLEGTGSVVLDRTHRIAYAVISPRTHLEPLSHFCEQQQYIPMVFRAVDSVGRPLYHTNVVMSVADRYVVVCLESIPDQTERTFLIETIQRSGKVIIPINYEQLNRFAGNLLQVHNDKGEKFLIGSSGAFASLGSEQLDALKSFNELLEVDIPTIESVGGGSARCMLAEIFLTQNRST